MESKTHLESTGAMIQAEIRRLEKNNGGYFGELIDVDALLTEQRHYAGQHGWQVDVLPARAGAELLALRRPVARPARRIYLSTGIHGDEPAGPLAIRELLRENAWPPDVEIFLCPCLNPTGLKLNRRESDQGIDLNRDYRQPRAAEIQAHVGWLERQPLFDLCLCLHEDWEAHGFYVYEVNPDHRPSLAEAMVEAVRAVCPIDASELIDGREASAGIIRPNLDPALRPEWPEAFYLIQHRTRLSYTLEAPSDFPLPVRVAALVTAVKIALNTKF